MNSRNSPQERVPVIISAIGGLSYMRSFPDDAALKTIARAVARFCEVEVVHHGSEEFPEEGDLGEVRPIEWLVEEIASACVFFPEVIRMRRIYEEKFPPLDGKSADELEEAIS